MTRAVVSLTLAILLNGCGFVGGGVKTVPPDEGFVCVVAPASVVLGIGESVRPATTVERRPDAFAPDSVVIGTERGVVTIASDGSIVGARAGTALLPVKCFYRGRILQAQVMATVTAPPPPPPPPPVPTLARIDITPANISISPGASVAFRVMGIYSDGTAREISQVTWRSDSSPVSPEGVFQSRAEGVFTVTAFVGGMNVQATVRVRKTSTTIPSDTVARPTRRDADGDTVPDHKDDCANTPSGTVVLTNGCPAPPTLIDTMAFTVGRFRAGASREWIEGRNASVWVTVQRGTEPVVQIDPEPSQSPDLAEAPAPLPELIRMIDSVVPIGDQAKVCFDGDSSEFVVTLFKPCQVKGIFTDSPTRFEWRIKPLQSGERIFYLTYRTWRGGEKDEGAGALEPVSRRFPVTVTPRPRSVLERAKDMLTDPKRPFPMILAILMAIGALLLALKPFKELVAKLKDRFKKPPPTIPPVDGLMD